MTQSYLDPKGSPDGESIAFVIGEPIGGLRSAGTEYSGAIHVMAKDGSDVILLSRRLSPADCCAVCSAGGGTSG